MVLSSAQWKQQNPPVVTVACDSCPGEGAKGESEEGCYTTWSMSSGRLPGGGNGLIQSWRIAEVAQAEKGTRAVTVVETATRKPQIGEPAGHIQRCQSCLMSLHPLTHLFIHLST